MNKKGFIGKIISIAIVVVVAYFLLKYFGVI